MATWWCVNCGRSLDHMGVPSHRAMHRRRGDKVEMHNASYRFVYDYTGQED